MSYRSRHNGGMEEADLDITPFMNLMIVLVPVLLLSMVFTRITVIDLQLPESAGTTSAELKQQQVEVVIRKSGLAVNFPEGMLLREVPFVDITESAQTDNEQALESTGAEQPDYAALSTILQELKRHLREKGADRRNINLLIQDEAPYDQIIATMDAVRAYKAVVASSVVDAELFPDIAFVDLPAGAISSLP